MPKRFKIFLDSSALISGLNSPAGGAGIIISAFLAGEFFVYISDQVIEETQQNIQTKFPLLKDSFLNFLLARPKIIKQPSLKEIRKAYKLILTEDAPILAAAIKSKPDFLIFRRRGRIIGPIRWHIQVVRQRPEKPPLLSSNLSATYLF